MGWLADHAWEAWLIAGVVLAVLELVSLDLVFVMLAGGAFAGAIAAAAHAPGVLSVIVALATAIGLLSLLRPPVLKALHRGPDLRTGTAALVGRRATVVADIAYGRGGRVKIGGEEWSAQPYDEDEAIPAGEVVDVVEIRGATAWVLRSYQPGQLGS
jgi:membrane protein implicated in regulation of membrane protease activity